MAQGCASYERSPVESSPKPVGSPLFSTESGSADSAATNGVTEEPAEPPAPAKRYPFHDRLPELIPAKTPARRIANMSPGQCRRELKQRKLPVKPAYGPARGIATPVRLDGPLHGIRFVAPGKRSVYGKLDCRLALALDEMAKIFEGHEVTEIHVDNMYRPAARLPRQSKRKPRKRSQHSYGLAADLVRLKLRDGSVLVVESDWHGEIGTPACGPDAEVRDPTDQAILLRNIVCGLAREGLFHHILTPNYDAAHRDHLHLDIKRDSKEMSVR
jgi:hypothetical protein